MFETVAQFWLGEHHSIWHIINLYSFADASGFQNVSNNYVKNFQINLAQIVFLYNCWLLHFKTDEYLFCHLFADLGLEVTFLCFSIRHSNLCNLLPQSTQKNWKRNEDPWTFQTLESYGLQMIFTLKRDLNELMYFNAIERKRDSMAEWNQFSPKVRQMKAVLKFDMFLYDNHAVMDHILIFRAFCISSTSIYSKKNVFYIKKQFLGNVNSVNHTPSWCYIIFVTYAWV